MEAKILSEIYKSVQYDDLCSESFCFYLCSSIHLFYRMCVFLTNVKSLHLGKKLSVEGKIYHKFDMKPHNENMEDYAKLCRERTNKYMTRTRQTQVISFTSLIFGEVSYSLISTLMCRISFLQL